MASCVFVWQFLARVETLNETTTTVHKLPENYTQSLFNRSTSKMIHLLGIFVIRKGKFGLLCAFVAIFGSKWQKCL